MADLGWKQLWRESWGRSCSSGGTLLAYHGERLCSIHCTALIRTQGPKAGASQVPFHLSSNACSTTWNSKTSSQRLGGSKGERREREGNSRPVLTDRHGRSLVPGYRHYLLPQQSRKPLSFPSPIYPSPQDTSRSWATYLRTLSRASGFLRGNEPLDRTVFCL